MGSTTGFGACAGEGACWCKVGAAESPACGASGFSSRAAELGAEGASGFAAGATGLSASGCVGVGGGFGPDSPVPDPNPWPGVAVVGSDVPPWLHASRP